MTTFGMAVLLWRLERRYSQEALAKRAGVSRPNLSAIERGKREVSLTTLRALAVALEVRPGALVDGEAPGGTERRRFSRERLEQIADAVLSHSVPDDRDRTLVSGLQALLQTRRTPLRGGRRASTRAWLQLSAAYPPELVQSLLQRIRDRGRLGPAFR